MGDKKIGEHLSITMWISNAVMKNKPVITSAPK